MQGATFNVSSARLENREAVSADIDKFKPTNVLNCAGITGRPNVDWCEDHKVRLRRPCCLHVSWPARSAAACQSGQPALASAAYAARRHMRRAPEAEPPIRCG